MFQKIWVAGLILAILLSVSSPVPSKTPIAKKELPKLKTKISFKVPVSRGEAKVPVSRGEAPVKPDFVELTDFEVTFYNDYGKTTGGTLTTEGRTVSVDPKIIPLGTWLEIILLDGQVLRRRAEDTGGAVKGKVIDVYSPAPSKELLKRGRLKNITVRILGRDEL